MRRAAPALAVLIVTGLGAPAAWAEDRVDFTTTTYLEKRNTGQSNVSPGNLTVVHPQVDVSLDVGESTTLGVGYSADVVSGATAAVYQVDATTGATPFEDMRHEGQVSLGFAGRRSSLTLSGGTGVERDYISINVGASGAVDLPGKNSNLAVSYTHNFDKTCDRENAMQTPLERQTLEGTDACVKRRGLLGRDRGDTVWRDLSIDTTQATLTQNLTPTAVMQVSLFGQVLRGFQSNPYRAVLIGRVPAQESIPEVRARAAFTARVNRFLPPVRGAVHALVRGYSDTWGISSITGEMGYSQYLGRSLLFRFHTRFYQQSAATFFKDAYFYETEGPAGSYFTGDRELGRLRNMMGGAKLSYIKEAGDDAQVWGLFDQLQLNLKGDVLLLDELPANNEDENPVGIGSQFLTSGQLLDAFMVQVGLLLRY